MKKAVARNNPTTAYFLRHGGLYNYINSYITLIYCGIEKMLTKYLN